jgi:hypothetical protein
MHITFRLLQQFGGPDKENAQQTQGRQTVPEQRRGNVQAEGLHARAVAEAEPPTALSFQQDKKA